MVCAQADPSLHEGRTAGCSAVASGLSHFALQAWDSHLPRDPSMRKALFSLCVFILLGITFVGCGDSQKAVVVPSVANAFAFMQEIPQQGYAFTPVLGQFVTANGSTQFQATVVKDPTTGSTVMADFGSLFLSKAGDKVVFDLYGGLDLQNSQWDVYIGNSDGTGLTQITNDLSEDSNPQLSPDGTKVVFNSVREGELGNTNMVVIRNVTNPSVGEQVLPMPLGAYDTWAPAYSPDGTKIVLEAWGWNETNGYFDGIVVMNADGSNAQLLTNPYATCDCWDESPAFTPDGTKIVFTHDINTGTLDTEDVYIMNADGSGTPSQLTDSRGYNIDPLVIHVAGLGDKVVFVSNRDNLAASATTGYELYSMNLDGSGLTRLTSNGLYDGFSQEWFEPQGTAQAAARESHVQRQGPQHKIQQPTIKLRW